MLPAEFVVVAILLRLLAGASYIVAILQGKARPNLVSWFFWGLTALIAFAVELSQGVGSHAFVTLAVGVGPVVVFAIAIAKGMHKAKFSATDKWCAGLTAIGVVMWVVTKDPVIALLMSIAVDFVSGIPTLIKSYKRPHTEHALPYCISAAAMCVALLTIRDWHAASWLFPAYILWTNVNFAVLIGTRIGPKMRRRAHARAKQLQPQLAYAEEEA